MRSSIVRGIARTQARIEVRQNGYLVQSLTVAPGGIFTDKFACNGVQDQT
ncbi:fimbria/pilus outer membrane usher protein [Escherichia coli]